MTQITFWCFIIFYGFKSWYFPIQALLFDVFVAVDFRDVFGYRAALRLTLFRMGFSGLLTDEGGGKKAPSLKSFTHILQ